jgi:hypothetical protein
MPSCSRPGSLASWRLERSGRENLIRCRLWPVGRCRAAQASRELQSGDAMIHWGKMAHAKTPRRKGGHSGTAIRKAAIPSRDCGIALVPEFLGEGVGQLCPGKSFRSCRVASLRSIPLDATASVSSSHAGPSVSGLMPFKRRKTMHAPSAARLLPSMSG